MSKWAAYKQEFSPNLRLALPIMAGQLGQVSVNFIDNLMVGRLGAESLAAVSLAVAIYIMFYVVGMGISYGLTPLIAAADGAKDHKSIPKLLKHSMIINLVYALFCALIIQAAVPVLDHLGQDHEVARLAKPYLVISGWAMIPLMFFQTLKCYAEGMSHTKPAMIASLTGNVFNVFFNFILIFGMLGFPALGVKGAAIGTLLSRFIMVALLLIILFRSARLKRYFTESSSQKLERSHFTSILSIGVPTSLQMFFEVSAFAAASLIMGTLGAIPQAAHQIAINLAAITFLTCVGLALASTIRVGNQLGQKNFDRMHSAGMAAILQVGIFMFFMAAIFILLRDVLPHIYISDKEVVAIASTLIVVAAFFQISDGVQVVAQGALRGMRDVKIPTIITFVAYWLCGIPISYIGASVLDLGPLGVWAGLLTGLTISAILLSRRFYKLSSALL